MATYDPRTYFNVADINAQVVAAVAANAATNALVAATGEGSSTPPNRSLSATQTALGGMRILK